MVISGIKKALPSGVKGRRMADFSIVNSITRPKAQGKCKIKAK
jgi:hypothetical protein